MDHENISDTDIESERLLIRLARETPVWKKFAQVAATTRTCRAFALAGIRARHPHASEDELRKRLAALILDPATMREVYGWDPEVEGY